MEFLARCCHGHSCRDIRRTHCWSKKIKIQSEGKEVELGITPRPKGKDWKQVERGTVGAGQQIMFIHIYTLYARVKDKQGKKISYTRLLPDTYIEFRITLNFL